jgi:hypothetical protein
MTNNPTTAAACTWEVTSQTPTTAAGENGQLASGQMINIRTGLGNTGQVFVPYSEYRPEVVRPKLADLAARLDAVAGLKG